MNSVLNRKYENYISLGWFCSVALELKSYSLRKFSSPFDWLLCPFQSVLELIQNRFSLFLDYNHLEQNFETKNHYRNSLYDIYFYHDFNEFVSLENQLPLVKEKYDRRISRFYEKITMPTLFFRYIKDEEELAFVSHNYATILKILKGFNINNEIVFISEKLGNVPNLFLVTKDDGDTVCREPFNAIDELNNYCQCVGSNRMLEKRHNFFSRLLSRVKSLTKRCKKKYVHSKIYR